VYYFKPTVGGEVRIFGFYTNKQTNKEKKKELNSLVGLQAFFQPLSYHPQRESSTLSRKTVSLLKIFIHEETIV